MKDSDLIEMIKEADTERLKEELINELNIQRAWAPDMGGATDWNVYRSCLYSALERAREED